MPKHRNKPNQETLYRMYVDEKCTLKNIADAYSASESGVVNWLKAAHIKLRSMSESWVIRRERYNDKFVFLEGVDREETIKRFGYDPADMSRKSDNLIVVICPECGKSREIIAHGYLERQLCKSCSKLGERHPIYGKHSAMLGKHHTEESKQKNSDSRKGQCTGADNHNWKGGATNHKYCHLWTEQLRESIRDKYDRECFLCGKTEEENGAKLSVHHTNSGKMCLCSYDCKLVPLCKVCHGRVGGDRFHWFSFIMCKLHLESSAQFMTHDSFCGM